MEQLFQLLDLTFSKIVKILNIYIACALSTIFLKYQFSSDYFFSANNLQLILISACIWIIFNGVLYSIIYAFSLRIGRFLKKDKIANIEVMVLVFKKLRMGGSANTMLRSSRKGIVLMNKHLVEISLILIQVYFILNESVFLVVASILALFSCISISVEHFLSNAVTRDIRIRNRQNPLN